MLRVCLTDCDVGVVLKDSSGMSPRALHHVNTTSLEATLPPEPTLLCKGYLKHQHARGESLTASPAPPHTARGRATTTRQCQPSATHWVCERQQRRAPERTACSSTRPSPATNWCTPLNLSVVTGRRPPRLLRRRQPTGSRMTLCSATALFWRTSNLDSCACDLDAVAATPLPPQERICYVMPPVDACRRARHAAERQKASFDQDDACSRKLCTFRNCSFEP